MCIVSRAIRSGFTAVYVIRDLRSLPKGILWLRLVCCSPSVFHCSTFGLLVWLLLEINMSTIYVVLSIYL